MPSIPTVSARKFIKVLQKKGFVLHRVTGSHHIFVRKADQLSVSVPVHAGRDLSHGITRSILKDAEITLEEFLQLL